MCRPRQIDDGRLVGDGDGGWGIINENLPFVRFINKEFPRCLPFIGKNERKCSLLPHAIIAHCFPLMRISELQWIVSLRCGNNNINNWFELEIYKTLVHWANTFSFVRFRLCYLHAVSVSFHWPALEFLPIEFPIIHWNNNEWIVNKRARKLVVFFLWMKYKRFIE